MLLLESGGLGLTSGVVTRLDLEETREPQQWALTRNPSQLQQCGHWNAIVCAVFFLYLLKHASYIFCKKKHGLLLQQGNRVSTGEPTSVKGS